MTVISFYPIMNDRNNRHHNTVSTIIIRMIRTIGINHRKTTRMIVRIIIRMAKIKVK